MNAMLATAHANGCLSLPIPARAAGGHNVFLLVSLLNNEELLALLLSSKFTGRQPDWPYQADDGMKSPHLCP